MVTGSVIRLFCTASVLLGLCCAPLQAADTSRTKPASTTQLTETQLIARTQELLRDLGYEVGSIDGKMGAATRSAIRRYQRVEGLTVDGEPSQALLSHLYGSLERRRAPVSTEARSPTAPTASTPGAPPEGSVGGGLMRSLTGLLGGERTTPQASTPTATVGIRGLQDKAAQTSSAPLPRGPSTPGLTPQNIANSPGNPAELEKLERWNKKPAAGGWTPPK